MILLATITIFLTTIIILFFNLLSNAWNDLTNKARNTYVTNIQNFVKEVRRDFSTKPDK